MTKYLITQKFFTIKLSEYGFGILDPLSGKNLSWAQGTKKALDPGSGSATLLISGCFIYPNLPRSDNVGHVYFVVVAKVRNLERFTHRLRHDLHHPLQRLHPVLSV
jgi:hypothetical protein